MKKNLPWNVKDVGFDARELAHRAARREGVPVGQWLNGVIRDHAEQQGLAKDDFTQEEKLDALVARLAGLAESVKAEEKGRQTRTATSKHRAVSSGASGAQSMSQSWMDDGDSEVRGGMAQRSRAAVSGFGPDEDSRARRSDSDRDLRDADRNSTRWEDDILLDQAMALVERRTTAAEEHAKGERQRMRIAALAKEVERLNRAEADAAADRRRVRGRAAGRAPEPVPPTAAGSSFDEPRSAPWEAAASRTAVAAQDRRLGQVLRREAEQARDSARVEATFEDFDQRLRELATRFDPRLSSGAGRHDRNAVPTPSAQGADESHPLPSARSQARRRDPIADITDRQADLDAFEKRRAALLSGTAQAAMDYGRHGLSASDEAPAARRAKVLAPSDAMIGSGDAFANLNEAFVRLTERLETRLDEAARTRAEAARQPDGEIDALKTGIAALGTRLDAMKEQVEQSFAAAGEREGLDGLRNEIAALQVGLTRLAPQSAIATLENAVRELGGQIDDSRRDGISEAVLQPLERLRSEVQKAVEAPEMRVTLDRIEGQLGALAQRVDDTGTIDPTAARLEELQAETAELRHLLQGAAAQFQAVERLEVQIGHLGHRVERLTENAPRAAVRDLELATNEIRTMLVELSPETALQDLSRKLDDLGERFGVIEEHIAAPSAMFDEFARRMDDAHAALADRLLRAAPVVDLAPIEDMIDGLSGKIDGLRYPVADMQALGGLIRGLAAQIEEARLPNADAKILDGLEAQVGRLAERLDRSDANLDAISSVERLVRDLFSQLDDTRSATIEAAETAARTAAQETLRGAALSSAGEEGAAPVLATRALEQVGQELSEFRKAQQVSEKRVHSTLLALNETLERMVDAAIVSARTPASPPIVAELKDIPTKVSEPAASVEVPAPAPSVAPELDAGEPKQTDAKQTDAKQVEIKRPVANAKTAAPAVDIGRAAALAEPMPDVSPLIAAARRAAQAAQTSAGEMSRKADIWDTSAKTVAEPGPAKGWRALFRQKRRPMLLSVASVVLLLGALQVARLTIPSEKTSVVATGETASKDDRANEKIAEAAPSADATTDTKPATGPVSTAAQAPASAPSATAAAPQVTASLVSPTPANAGLDKKAPVTTSFVPADAVPKALAVGLRDLAERGDPAAEAEVGVRLAEGKGVARDAKSAANWFERAAKQGFAPAEYRLASAYEKGNGVTADPVQAVAWYEKAATQGNVRAMHNLAVMAAEGSAGKADYARAATWFTKAAEHGVRDSQYNLAILYARGLGLSQDLSRSYTWFSIAAAQGDADAAKKRDDVAAKLDPDKIAAAKAEAAAFKPMPVEKAANDITAPAGGWDVASPATGTAPTPKISSM